MKGSCSSLKPQIIFCKFGCSIHCLHSENSVDPLQKIKTTIQKSLYNPPYFWSDFLFAICPQEKSLIHTMPQKIGYMLVLASISFKGKRSFILIQVFFPLQSMLL
uniref:Uncharacterized protein n=1 Tax=Micrurus spixii TaxID=129469 RepID=A0A2D4MD41_9SAUR